MAPVNSAGRQFSSWTSPRLPEAFRVGGLRPSVATARCRIAFVVCRDRRISTLTSSAREADRFILKMSVIAGRRG